MGEEGKRCRPVCVCRNVSVPACGFPHCFHDGFQYGFHKSFANAFQQGKLWVVIMLGATMSP